VTAIARGQVRMTHHRIDLGVEDGQVMNAGQEPLP
jgi:hypothetical protein